MDIKSKLNSAKEIVVRNQAKIMAGALIVTTTGAVVQHLALKKHDDFLKENGLYEKYYETDES